MAATSLPASSYLNSADLRRELPLREMTRNQHVDNVERLNVASGNFFLQLAERPIGPAATSRLKRALMCSFEWRLTEPALRPNCAANGAIGEPRAIRKSSLATSGCRQVWQLLAKEVFPDGRRRKRRARSRHLINGAPGEAALKSVERTPFVPKHPWLWRPRSSAIACWRRRRVRRTRAAGMWSFQ
jgi:hypothetical protein